MPRLVADCRLGPWRDICTLTFAGERCDVLPEIVAHCARAHGQILGPELRAMLVPRLIDERAYLELEGVPLEAPAA